MPRRDRSPRQRMEAGARREAILAAAVEHFSDRPYDQVSVAAVAAGAAASEALVYRYFPRKEVLYAAAVDSAVTTLLDRQDAADAGLGPDADGRLRLATGLDVYLDWIDERAAGWSDQLRVTPGHVPEVASVRARVTEQYLARLRAAVGVAPGESVVAEYAMRGYLAFVDGVVLEWVERGRPPGERRIIVDQAIAVLGAALRTGPATA